ncbi:MAG: helix-turn-helix transcriptional regulator [Clostridia bacterium]|jgi:transcriptional regulator with XRE-family HTH domain|nr:helix-turn-helix transcriptional regulator [Clostridia bacterium]
MDKKLIVQRIDELLKEKHKTNYAMKEDTGISSTIYQWRKNTVRDATRTPSLRSIEKVCDYLGVALSYFFSFTYHEKIKYRVVELAEKLNMLDELKLNIVEVLVNYLIDQA